MKILIASDLHYPTINGVATFSRNLAQGLARRGHEVVVIAPSQTGGKSVEADENYKIYRTLSVPFPFYQNFKISLYPLREVKNILDDFDPDVIHIQMMLGIGQAVMRQGNKMGIPIVSTNHAIPENLLDNLKLLAPVSRPINRMLKSYGTRFHAKADYVTLPTQSAIDMLDADTRIAVPMEAVSNGIDLSKFKPGDVSTKLYEKYKIPRGVPVITYVGRLDAEKHLHVLLRAFVRVVSVMPKTRLLVIGDGTERLNLEYMARELGVVKNTIFTGKVSEEDKILLERVGSVFCITSPAELQSIATLEAMASGQPIVAVDAGALGELCQNEVNGFLCELDDDAGVASGLLAILSDEKLRRRFSKQSLAIAKTHDIETTLDRFEQIYREVSR